MCGGFCTSTNISHLHDGTVPQFLKILCHVLKSTWQNFTKVFNLHITVMKRFCL